MWITFFVIAVATAICLSVAAYVMRDRDATQLGMTRLSSEMAVWPCVAATVKRDPDSMQSEMTRLSSETTSLMTEPVEPDLKMLLASPEVRLVMRADHVDERELLAEYKAISAQLQKNASSLFDKAVCRLQNMAEMMDRLGFDAETLARQHLDVKSVFRTCQVCPEDEVCHDWLVQAPKSFNRAPAFCPNAEHFARTWQMAA